MMPNTMIVAPFAQAVKISNDERFSESVMRLVRSDLFSTLEHVRLRYFPRGWEKEYCS